MTAAVAGSDRAPHHPQKVVGLIALVTIILLLCADSRGWIRALIVLLTVPFSVAKAIGSRPLGG